MKSRRACHSRQLVKKTFRQHVLTLICLLILVTHAIAANMRSFIEAVRRKAPVVYVGSVKQVQQLARTKFDIKAQAIIDVSAVMRGPGPNRRDATLEYSSY